MPADVRGSLAASVLALGLLAGCTPTETLYSPTPSTAPSAPPGSVVPSVPPAVNPAPGGATTPLGRAFKVTTTMRPHSLDPAGAQTAADAVGALNLFQRLLKVNPETRELKPDAGDCQYKQPTVYECVLVKDLTFANGNRLTASDVKFSIERAQRLKVPGTSLALLTPLQKVEVVDEWTVRFTLAWTDAQFGAALATPAASIVDEQSYPANALRPDSAIPVGSGPFVLAAHEVTGLTFTRRAGYVGPDVPRLPVLRLAFESDSAATEQVASKGLTDAVWGGLDAAALQRLRSGVTPTTLMDASASGHYQQRLIWNPASPLRARADVRAAVLAALTPDRTEASLLPAGVLGASGTFPVGGRAKVAAAPSPGAQVTLTLSYAARGTDQADLARLVAERLQTNARIGVRLSPDTPGADLHLTQATAWVNSAYGWLQDYTEAPLPASAAKVSQLLQGARGTIDQESEAAMLVEVQKLAAADATVVPLTGGTWSLLGPRSTTLVATDFGPGWQLGLWGFHE